MLMPTLASGKDSIYRATRLLFLGIIALLMASPSFAQGSRRSPAIWSASVSPASARPGEVVTVSVTAKIKPTYHLYSVVPVPPPGPQATELTVAGVGLKAEGAVTETAPKQVNDPNFSKTLGIHDGTATFTRYLRLSDAAKPGPVTLSVSVRYMACTESFCLPPTTASVPAPAFTVEAGGPRPEYRNPPAAAVAAPLASPVMLVEDSGTAGGSLLSFLAAAFGAGILALVTPCVFPMIPVTLAFFTKQATAGKPGQEKASIVPLAATYCLGIILAFTAIGAVLAATVGAAGANRFAASPWTNLVFGILFIVFALALLEVVEIRPPAFLQRGGGDRATGTLGVLGMGLTFVVAAFTCTAPFIGTVLVAAASASTGAQWVRPILGMMAFATALALPFFVLALFPGLLAKLPKSGVWLTTVKGSMGFLELAAALKFLSNTDLVWQWKALTQPMLLSLWAVIALAGAAWLLGLLYIGFNTPDRSPTPARRVGAGLFAALAAYCFWGLSGRPLNDWVVAFLPPTNYGYGVSEGSQASADEPVFLETLEAALAQAKAENKPVFIDFTGYTCTNCRWMEKNVFPVPAVKSELEQFVRVRLYTDGGKDGAKNQEYQEKVFGDVALPLYGILTPDGKPAARSAGITRDPGKFAGFLQKSRTRQTTRNREKVRERSV
ncbi:MAG: thioredoxin family protein [Cytophagales bacterium]|nr:thioredoxin family protein [Armatimonadota bacterium]